MIYPALEAKVANVTLSYQVEHEDEVRELLVAGEKQREEREEERGS